ncbi:MAG: glutamine-hydrolyzing carbamoyl-phosphate synthase small subunit [Deltaproteobacteria bacterium]|nr:glutamine-hydrolyzing carbamoyl-phosphate synthase small subunit [Deltaproteobacteria bacterium]
MKAILALEDGRTFKCKSFTGAGEASGEVVFNTGMTGYQEILTDPSYKKQMVTMTYPLIGNYGTNNEDVESDRIQVSAFLTREYQKYPSNFRSTASLAEYLKNSGNNQGGVLGIEELDTRALTRHIRNAGAMRAFISTEDFDPVSCVQKAKAIPDMAGQDLVKEVTTGSVYRWTGGEKIAVSEQGLEINGKLWEKGNGKKRIVVFDYGVKFNILRCLESAGCDLIVVPAATAADVVKAMEPDGIFLSNGPGDPEPVTYAINTIKGLIGYRPIFGICLGLQILGLALGGKTFKLKFGHRGANQPVKNLITRKIEITSQNHGFALSPGSLNNLNIEITHLNLNDNTVEGFKHKELPLQAVQYHPEASPGPHDARYFFNNFVRRIEA